LFQAAQGLDPPLLEGAGTELCTHSVSEKQKPRLNGGGALAAARSEAVSVSRNGSAGAWEPCQSFVEMNRKDI
jgi:hypothetical protein